MSEQREADLALIEEGNAIESGLTIRESDFIESLNDWMENHQTMTEKQRDWLERILEAKG